MVLLLPHPLKVPQSHEPPPATCHHAVSCRPGSDTTRPGPALSLPGQAVCPELSSSEKDSCTASCVNDESCPQGTKCCARSPCSQSCVVPLKGPTGPKLCLERSECSRDDQCRDNLKCCFSSCAMSCMVRTTESGMVGVEGSLAHPQHPSLPCPHCGHLPPPLRPPCPLRRTLHS
ncbi:unnamed protein product, partial [Rangifer tarandus platyrhynchus]